MLLIKYLLLLQIQNKIKINWSLANTIHWHMLLHLFYKSVCHAIASEDKIQSLPEESLPEKLHY